jgi:hypothetical protein
MADDFDPYYQWLGIPPKYQPPSHYRLLALEEFEGNPDVIESAADRQMAHVRLFQNGPQGEISQKLLNEITAAKLCLLNPGKKAEYDKKLRAEKEATEAAAQPKPPRPRAVRATPIEPADVESADAAVPFDEGDDIVQTPSFDLTGPQSASVGPARPLPVRRRSGLPPAAIAGVVGAVLVAGALIFLATRPGRPIASQSANGTGKTPVQVDPAIVPGKTYLGNGQKTPVEPARKTDVEPAKTAVEAKTSKTIDDPPTPDPGPKKKTSDTGKSTTPEAAADLSAPVDLVKVVDLERDVAAGQWSVARRALRGDAPADYALLRVPHNCPREYDLTAIIRRVRGEGVLAIGLVFGQQRVALLCDADGPEGKGKVTMLHTVKDLAVGKTIHEGPVLSEEDPTLLTIQVRQSGIAVLDADTLLFAWRGAATDLSLAPLWAKRSPGDGLFIGIQNAGYEFEKLELQGVNTKPPAVAAKKRPPVPPMTERDAARQHVRGLFDAEIKAARTPQDKTALVQKLLQQASREEEAATKYALLDMAGQSAVEAGDAEGALKANEQLASAFHVDGEARLLEVFGQLSAANVPADKRRALVESMLDAIGHAASEERFKAASDLLGLATKTVAKFNDLETRRSVTALRERVDQLRAWSEEADKARTVLADMPDDAAANKALGRYLCFGQEDWENGLPHLAKSDDAKLKAAAVLDLANPDTPPKQAAAGDAWWDLALPATGYGKLVLQKRTAHWYSQAVSGLKDPAKGTVEKRLATLGKALADASGEASGALVAKWIVGDFFLTATLKRDKTYATLAFAADGGVTSNGSAVGRWTVEGGQVRITYEDKDQGTVVLRSRGKDAFTGQQTRGTGEVLSCDLKRVVVASTWEVYDERIPKQFATSQQLVLYSNGKANDIYGDSTWSVANNVLTLDWKDYRRLSGFGKGKGGSTGLQGSFPIQQGGKIFRGPDSRGRVYRGERVASPGAPKAKE